MFDSVSRMSRNAAEGIELYLDLYEKGINLVFLKERFIDTDTYKSALNNNVELTGEDIDDILTGVNSYLKKLATKQIRLAFEQAQKEVDDLHKRTSEGIETARLNEKQVGRPQGIKVKTKKGECCKKTILKYSKDFKGNLNDSDVMILSGVSRNTYYKYKLIEELENQKAELK